MRQSWRQWWWLCIGIGMMCAGCTDQLLPPNASTTSNSDGAKEHTAEVVPLRAVEAAPEVIRVKVHNGDIDVIAVDSTGVFTGAYFVQDDIVFLDDIAEAVNFAAPTPSPNILADEARGVGGPPARTHVRVPEGSVLDLHTPKGNIHVSGKLGAIRAVADNGSIEVRGQIGAANLMTHGDKTGILVDGVTSALTLVSDNGDIYIVTEKSMVSASTGGSIFFSGELLSGNNYFTTTGKSPITLIMPRGDTYAVIANTINNDIAVQYPVMPSTPLTICGTMDPGWPVDTHFDTNGQKPRGQFTLGPGSNPITNSTVFSGIVTSQFVAFHTTVRFVKTMIPDVSDLFVDTLDYLPAIPGIRTRVPYTPSQTIVTPIATTTAVAPAPAASSTNAVETQGIQQGFIPPDAIPTAIPLDTTTSNPTPATAPTAVPTSVTILPTVIAPDMRVITRGNAYPGHGDNCPLTLSPVQLSADVHIHVSSAGGLIRLLQMSPGRP